MSNLVYGVVGTGAIGGFYGGLLADAGQQVHFLLHNDYNYVKQNGLTIDSKIFVVKRIEQYFYSSPQEMPPCDVIIVGLKTVQNHLLKNLIQPLLKKNSLVILIQNGLGMEEDLQAQLPDTQIAGGVAYIAVSKFSAGVITHQELGNLSLGMLHENTDTTVLEQVIADFNQTQKIKCVHKNLNEVRWQKLVWNIPFNGLSVILDAQTDAMIFDKNTNALAAQMMEEVLLGAEKCGVQLAGKIVADSLALTERMKPYSPSMKLDFENHRPMEIKYMYEKPVEMAQRAGAHMPKVEMLAKMLRFVEDRNYPI
jgi:2-dehydropantoate 2-reductase